MLLAVHGRLAFTPPHHGVASSRLRRSPSARRPYKPIIIYNLPNATQPTARRLASSSQAWWPPMTPCPGTLIGRKFETGLTPTRPRRQLLRVGASGTNHAALALLAAPRQSNVFQKHAIMASGHRGKSFIAQTDCCYYCSCYGVLSGKFV